MPSADVAICIFRSGMWGASCRRIGFPSVCGGKYILRNPRRHDGGTEIGMYVSWFVNESGSFSIKKMEHTISGWESGSFLSECRRECSGWREEECWIDVYEKNDGGLWDGYCYQSPFFSDGLFVFLIQMTIFNSISFFYSSRYFLKEWHFIHFHRLKFCILDTQYSYLFVKPLEIQFDGF